MQTSSVLQWQMLSPFQICSFGAVSCISENKNKLSFLDFFSQNSTVTIEEFHCKLQEATNFPLRPFVIPFLKVTEMLALADVLRIGPCRLAVSLLGNSFQAPRQFRYSPRQTAQAAAVPVWDWHAES